ncbi:MAG: tRNA pseudouridine(38-40) synthase TruA [Proteobacteria bacterium]|nr:tRNA pseudouridine(38-40) synthase TruA [Pseudomonadota bacterium]
MRYACGVEYDGQPFYGFQTQIHEPTVQSCLEAAISKVADQTVKISCSGRTDTGVSARHQVIHFDSEAKRTDRQWTLGINTSLPDAISILWVKPVNDSFHARFSAISRSYEYSIINRQIRPAIGRHQLTWIRTALDHQLMHEAVQSLIGTHDFNAFRSSRCQSHVSVKTILSADVTRQQQLIKLNIIANGFLHHMIRNIVGSLLPIGNKEQPVSWLQEILDSRDRCKAGITAAANGLVFKNVCYPKEFEIPEHE